MRVLAILAFSYAAAVALACYLLPASWLPFLALACLLLGGGLARLKRRWLRPAVLTILALSVGFGWYWGHGLLTLERARALDGQTLEISGKLLCYPAVYDDYCSLQLRLEGEGQPSLTVRVTTEDMSAAEASPGDRISCSVKCSLADRRYGDRYDADLAKGIYLRAYAKSELVRTQTGFDLETVPARLARRVTDLVQALFPADTAPFIRSLLMGDRQQLYEDVGLYNSLRRAGLTHVVAVSGMHVAFLVSLLQLLLGRNRYSSLLCIALVWLFVLMTGAGPSAVRAGVMQTMLLLAPIFGRENDPVTSLAAALGLILLLNPYAVASISLQLSFGAMAGLLSLSQRMYEAMSRRLPDGLLASPLRALLGILSSSLGVLVFTVPLMAIHFGSIAVLSPISNLLGLWCVSALFCLSAAACGIGALLPAAGRALAWLASWLARYLFWVAGLISGIPWEEVYMEGPLGPVWLIFCYLFLAVMLFSRLRPGLKVLICSGVALLSLLPTNAVVARAYRNAEAVFAAVDVGQGQCLVAMAGDTTLMVDCGGIYSLDSAGEQAGAYLLSRGRTRLDALILTHLHADHCNGVPLLLELVEVEQIILPADMPDEDDMLGDILSAAAKHQVQVEYLETDEQLQFGKLWVRLFAPVDLGDLNERCLTGVISAGDYDMLFTGDVPKSVEKELIQDKELTDLELLIVGHHGSRGSSSGELLGSIGADTAIISTGYNTFGHPTQEVLDRLAAYGYQIYRTDLNGTVEIRLG